jgi:pimeloyl-ACP methyl ester carboxylesterase
MNRTFRQLTNTNAGLLAVILVAGCATPRSTSSDRLDHQVARADVAYRNLKLDQVSAYNNAVASIAQQIDGKAPNELRSQLGSIGIKLDQPNIKLPLARYHVVPNLGARKESTALGVPMLLDYDTTNAPLYPREGLIVSTTAIYRRVHNEPHLSLISGKDSFEINGSIYPLKIDNVAPITAMTKRGRRVARSGFNGMLDSTRMPVKEGIFLTEPYDPNKIPVLMVHGLQSTPFAFVSLVDAIRRNPALSDRFQVWTFLYGTGTPVMFNALELRRELDKTITALDPHDHDFATRHIIVLGHSMGGLMAHTLVSSSGEKIWNALFEVSPQQLRGDPAMIRRLSAALHFRRNPRVVRAIFAATPHRGSKLAENWIGQIGASLIRLRSDVRTDVVTVMANNRDALTPSAHFFDRNMNFTSVHTLSPRDPALNALVDLPIEVPFHSIIGTETRRPGGT